MFPQGLLAFGKGLRFANEGAGAVGDMNRDQIKYRGSFWSDDVSEKSGVIAFLKISTLASAGGGPVDELVPLSGTERGNSRGQRREGRQAARTERASESYRRCSPLIVIVGITRVPESTRGGG